MSLRVAAALIGAAALVLAGCGDDGPVAGSPGTEPSGAPSVTEPASEPVPASVTVQSLDNTFRPEVVEVEVGTEVVWINAGRNDHDVTPSDGSTDWGVDADGFGPGDEYRHVFTEPGEYPYFCSIHGTAAVGQLGTIIVSEGPTG